MRCPGSAPSGLVWSKKLRAAMSSEWPCAAFSSCGSSVSAPQPLAARSLFTSATTCATVSDGADDASGVLVAVRDGRADGRGAGASFLAGRGLLEALAFFVGDADGDGDVEADGGVSTAADSDRSATGAPAVRSALARSPPV